MKKEIIWIVLNANDTYAGAPCYSWEEAEELLAQDKERKAYILNLLDSDVTDSYNGLV